MNNLTPKSPREDQHAVASHIHPLIPFNKIGAHTANLDKNNILKTSDGSRPLRSTFGAARNSPSTTPAKSGLPGLQIGNERPKRVCKRPVHFGSDIKQDQRPPPKKQMLQIDSSDQEVGIPVGTHMHAKGLPIHAKPSDGNQPIFLFAYKHPKVRADIVEQWNKALFEHYGMPLQDFLRPVSSIPLDDICLDKNLFDRAHTSTHIEKLSEAEKANLIANLFEASQNKDHENKDDDTLVDFEQQFGAEVEDNEMALNISTIGNAENNLGDKHISKKVKMSANSDKPKSDQQKDKNFTKSNEPEIQVGTTKVTDSDIPIPVYGFVRASNSRLYFFSRKCKISKELYSIDQVKLKLVDFMKEFDAGNRQQISSRIKQKLGHLQKALGKWSTTAVPVEQNGDNMEHEEDEQEELEGEGHVQNDLEEEVSIPEECTRSSKNVDKIFNDIGSQYLKVIEAVRSHDDLMREKLKEAITKNQVSEDTISQLQDKIAKDEKTISQLNEELDGLRVSDDSVDEETKLTQASNMDWNDENFKLIKAFDLRHRNPLRGAELIVPKFHTEDVTSGKKLLQRKYYQLLNFDVGGDFVRTVQKDDKQYGQFTKDGKNVYVSCPYGDKWVLKDGRVYLEWVVMEETE
ncbi:hypothetical protein B0J14DRAFT_686286 [Halenospora varia]|nr:hypothetical protein B0J14DRAFT_686286 [Halenospora varia]